MVAREQIVAERFGDLLGRSARMRELFADLVRIAQSDASLLVEGETGSGKSWWRSPCTAPVLVPRVRSSCSIAARWPPPWSRASSSVRNAAPTRERCRAPASSEQAHKGTIFLDELGELPKELQPKLLRVLERREVRRLGGQRTLPVDVRVVPATDRNLAAEVKRGSFREDLYFRVATARVQVRRFAIAWRTSRCWSSIS